MTLNSSNVSNFNESTNWLTIALIENSANTVFKKSNFTNVKLLPAPSLSGLRTGQIPTLENEFFAELNASQTYYLLKDALQTISGPQYIALSSDAIAGINPEYIQYINDTVFNQLTCEQIIALNNNNALKNNITSNQPTFNTRLVGCTFGLISPDTLWVGFGISAAVVVVITIIAIFIISRKGDYAAV